MVTTGNDREIVRLTELQEPLPSAGELVIQVEACGVNPGELRNAGSRPKGSRIGWDMAGTVSAPALDGSGPADGTRVVAIADSTGWAEYVAISTDKVATLPAGVGFSDAAALPTAGLTALHVLRKVGWLLDSTVLVTGAGGGVGRYIVQIASLVGARVVAAVGDPEHGEGLLDLGADTVIMYSDIPEQRPDVVLDSVGGDVLTAALTVGGAAISFGNSSGLPSTLPGDWGPSHPSITLSPMYLLESLGRSCAATDLGCLLRLVAAGRLDPQVVEIAPWAEPHAAFGRLLGRNLNGKLVLTLS
ncbi:zinc-binding dehydrogenase [Nocardia sp. NPDC003963]